MLGEGIRWLGRSAAVALVAAAATVATAAVLPALPALPAAPTVAANVGPTVQTVAGTGTPGSPHSGSPAAAAPLDAPQSIAVDAAGDLAIADTNACQVDVVASHRARMFGRTMSPGHLYVVAGGSCRSQHHGAPIGFPVGVAWGKGQLFVLDRTTNSVVAVEGSGRAVPYAGSGRSDAPHLEGAASTSPLDDPGGVATDPSGNLYIADTGDCRVLMVPRTSGMHFGQQMSSGHLYAVAGTGTCTLANPSGPASTAPLSAPTAVSVDAAGDLYITESGRQDVDEVPATSGTFYGTAIGAGDIAIVAGSGSNNTYLSQGQPATGSYAEMNYPGGTTVDSSGDLFIADGSDHDVLVVPAQGTTLWGRALSAGDLYTAVGAVPSSPPGDGAGDGTQWLGTHLADPTDVVWAGGHLVVVDAGLNKVVRVS